MHIITHRGGCPENTLEGFSKNWDLGCRRFECDVHMTCDAVIVVCHDFRIGNRMIAQSKYAELGSVLILADLLKWLRDKREEYYLAIEIKPRCLDALYLIEKCIFDLCGSGMIEIISKHKCILKNTVIKHKGFIAGWWGDGVAFCEKWGCDSLWLHHSKYKQSLYDACRQKKIRLYVWTMNCDGIVTDCAIH